MSEILNAIKLKDKVTIISVMSAFAVVLSIIIGVLSFALADRHAHIYDYSLEMESDGSFNVVGVCTVDNCEAPYFRQNKVSGVKLLSAMSPTCSGSGNRVYSYSYNGINLKYTEELPKEAHTYHFELVTRDGVLYLNGRCNVDGCADPYIFVSNIEDIKLISTVKGNCFTPSKETYSYVVAGKNYTFVTLVDEEIPHTLNGRPATSFEDKDGKYPLGTKGVNVLGDNKIACGATGNGYYICELCKQVEVVKVIRDFHKFLYNEKNVTAPDTFNTGHAILNCHNTECEETVDVILPPVMVGQNAFVVSEATELHPQVVRYSYESMLYGFTFEKDYEIGEPLPHDYVYSLEPNQNGSGKMDLVGKCGQPECQTPELRQENVETTLVDTSTCVTPGQLIWSYEHEGKTLTFVLPSFDLADHSYKYDKSKAENPSLTKAGVIELYCSTEGCDHAILVNLPKVEIGVNATQTNETEEYIVVDYVYETEYDCTVVLNILIYK